MDSDNRSGSFGQDAITCIVYVDVLESHIHTQLPLSHSLISGTDFNQETMARSRVIIDTDPVKKPPSQVGPNCYSDTSTRVQTTSSPIF